MKVYVLILVIISCKFVACSSSRPCASDGCEVSKALYDGNEAEAIRLLQLGFDASKPDQYGRTPMHFAADQGFITAIQHLIENGYTYQIHSKDKSNELPLNYAVNNKYFETAELLIKMGSDVNSHEMRVYNAPLAMAASSGDEKMVKLLLDNGADIQSEQSYALTARWYAEDEGHWKIVHWLDAYASVRKLPEPKETCKFHICRVCQKYYNSIK